MTKILCEKFNNKMNDYFFHPSRDNMYPTKEIKEVATSIYLGRF